MILHEICGSESNAIYRELEIANGARQYDFLRSIVTASLAVGKPFISSAILRALNFQAIACLHTSAGNYRPCEVKVGIHTPPPQYLVHDLMDDLINTVNRHWEGSDPVALAAYTLWRLNFIHPFINGNGRTARAAAYFVLCVHFGSWLPGTTILPELLRAARARYVDALVHADRTLEQGNLDLSPLHNLLVELLNEQLNGSAPESDAVADVPGSGDTPEA
ncbi:Fic family protein [Ottowia testudinis]|uniref:Fic family protein n=1 Tax=Ottowia testudinis TaxID=2816950 RepID=A0A975CJG2_9BURK|nr:Fic family protein [Ottowia testudinis]QTD44548.1 Fic family protein [Ottowia testudinis]